MGCLSAYNLGMCPDWDWNQRPFGSQAGAQSTEPHQPWLDLGFYNFYIIFSGFTVSFYTFLLTIDTVKVKIKTKVFLR